MARYKKKGRRSAAKMTVPMAIAAPIALMGLDLVDAAMKKDTGRLYQYAGVGTDGKFNVAPLMAAYGPLAVGTVIHIGASKLGVNKAIGRARIPFIRI